MAIKSLCRPCCRTNGKTRSSGFSFGSVTLFRVGVRGVLLFLTPVPEVATVGHSGGDPQPGQDEFLQYDPDCHKTDHNQDVIHGISLSVHAATTCVTGY